MTVRQGSLRLTVSSDGKRVLHDLAADPGQEHDVASEHPEAVDRLFRLANAVTAAPRRGEPLPETIDEDLREALRALIHLLADAREFERAIEVAHKLARLERVKNSAAEIGRQATAAAAQGPRIALPVMRALTVPPSATTPDRRRQGIPKRRTNVPRQRSHY